MDYINYKNGKWPCRVSYYALKQYQAETGKGIETLEEDITNLEILLHYSIIAGCKADDVEFTLKREDMEFMLDESMTEFNNILTGAFPTSTGAQKGKKK